jgi:hypothetical protein
MEGDKMGSQTIVIETTETELLAEEFLFSSEYNVVQIAEILDLTWNANKKDISRAIYIAEKMALSQGIHLFETKEAIAYIVEQLVKYTK